MSTIPSYGTNDYEVHLGFWINWSHGKIKGSTVTLTRQNGNLLIAFLALMVGATGRSLWRLMCFCLHRRFSASNLPQDAIYHQRQVILRNSETATQGAWELCKTMWVWSRKKAARSPVLRLLAPTIIGIIILTSFTAAGILSSRVSADDANEVQLTGNDCGIIGWTGPDEVLQGELNPHETQKTKSALRYVNQCYNPTSSDSSCQPYVKRRLNLDVSRNIGCPFDESICLSRDENLLLDTGYINSHEDLGINSPPKDRFLYRGVHKCAPLKSEGFSEVYNATDRANPGTSTPVMRLNYGTILRVPSSRTDYTNYTYQVPINDSYVNLDGYLSASSPTTDYNLGRVWAYSGNTTDATTYTRFEPIPELQSSNADVLLLFLTAPTVLFVEQTEDLWFSAHQPGRTVYNVLMDTTTMSYYKDGPVSTIGCTIQSQFCDASRPESDPDRCGTLNGDWDDKELDKIWKDEYRREKMKWAYRILHGNAFSIQNFVESVGPETLLARYTLRGQYQSKLPKHQWQLEMENLVSVTLMSLQDAFVEAANGQSRPRMKQALERPLHNNTAQMTMCTSQKIKSTRFSSFSVLGLSIIIAFGVVVILLDIFLEPIISYFQSQKSSSKLRNMFKKSPHKSIQQHKQYEWNATSTLQLQRFAHESIGCGEWSRTANETPITLPGQKLGVLHLAERKGKVHPRLVNHVATFDTMLSGATLEKQETLNSDHSNKAASAGGSEHIERDLSIHTAPKIDQRER